MQDAGLSKKLLQGILPGLNINPQVEYPKIA